ncbi:MAG: YhcH/YjgK/YiaL family protein [Fibrobacteria bacterium]
MLAKILAADPRFGPAFLYLERCRNPGSTEARRLMDLSTETTHEVLLDAGSVVFEQVYITRGRQACFFESHRKYIDVQFILEGEEIVDIAPIAGLVVDQPYLEENDVIKYLDGGSVSQLRLRAGEAAVFFPEDGHMPGQSAAVPSLVRKAVIKVLVAPLSVRG